MSLPKLSATFPCRGWICWNDHDDDNDNDVNDDNDNDLFSWEWLRGDERSVGAGGGATVQHGAQVMIIVMIIVMMKW